MNYSEMEQEIANLKEERVTLKAEIGEMRRLQDRLFTIVISSWGIIVAIVVTLIGVNALNNIRVYNRDIQAVHDELKKNVGEARNALVKDHNTAIGEKFKELEKELLAENKKELAGFRQDMNKDKSDGFAYTLGYVADIRLSSREVELAIRAALEQFNQATQGRGTYQPYALDKLTDVLTIGAQDGKCIPEELQSEVQTILERQDTKGEARGIRLKETLKSYRAKKLCPSLP